ncbi:MAG: cytochrome-c peroxidase, partial [Bacteroidetes bacterium]|nr:cytochrome-c peroxidase [Bacteroidota bacterium]
MLYFDPRLSSDGTVSCNSCHNVMNGGTDNRSFSAGVKGQTGGRNSPTVLNAVFLSVQFWDGREPNLKEQAKGPLINPVEMGNKNHDEVINRVKKIHGYVQAFKTVYPGNEPLNIENLATAIAAYEKTLTTLNSPFDKFNAG